MERLAAFLRSVREKAVWFWHLKGGETLKRSTAFTLLGLGSLSFGIGSFLFLGAFGTNPVLGIVLGLVCVVAAIIFVNKGDPSRLPQAHCWACGRAFESPSEKKLE